MPSVWIASGSYPNSPRVDQFARRIDIGIPRVAPKTRQHPGSPVQRSSGAPLPNLPALYSRRSNSRECLLFSAILNIIPGFLTMLPEQQLDTIEHGPATFGTLCAWTFLQRKSICDCSRIFVTWLPPSLSGRVTYHETPMYILHDIYPHPVSRLVSRRCQRR